MTIDQFSWNKHEQELKLNNKLNLPSVRKVKIIDDDALRLELEEILIQLNHKELASWAIEQAMMYTLNFDKSLQQDTRLTTAKEALNKRINGDISAFELRQSGFLANQLAKESTTDLSKFSARVFAQAIATGHMRGHAIVSADYAIKVSNISSNDDLKRAIKVRKNQIKLALSYIDK